MNRGATPPFNLEEWLQSLRVFDEETEEAGYVVYNGTINGVDNPVYLFDGPSKTVAICVKSWGVIYAVNETGIYEAAVSSDLTWDNPLIEAAGLTGFSGAGSDSGDVDIRRIRARLDPA